MPVRSPALVTSFPPLDISADGRLLAACVLVGAATRELERELVSGEGRQLGGSIPRAIGCNVVALQPGGAERGPHNSLSSMFLVRAAHKRHLHVMWKMEVGWQLQLFPEGPDRAGSVTAPTGFCGSNRSITGAGSKWAEAPAQWDLFLQLFQTLSCRSW